MKKVLVLWLSIMLAGLFTLACNINGGGNEIASPSSYHSKR